MTEAIGVIDEKTVGVWFVPTTETQDWMCTIREIEPNQKYEIIQRFRYYAAEESGDPFDGKDKKSWYKATVTGTRNFVIGAVRTVAQMCFAAGALHEPYELLNDGDMQEFIKKFLDAPFVFVRVEAKPK